MNLIDISEEAFAAIFKPTANHLNSNASFDWGDGCGTMFETYGDELAFVRTQAPDKVWSDNLAMLGTKPGDTRGLHEQCLAGIADAMDDARHFLPVIRRQRLQSLHRRFARSVEHPAPADPASGLIEHAGRALR